MAQSRYSYGWVIVVVATLALVVSNGLAITGIPVFSKPIREEFVAIGAIDGAWAESFIASCANITFLTSGVFSLIGGWLITRFRLKPMMLVGCVLLGGGLVLHSQAVSANVVYFARFLMGASLGFIGVAPCVVLVSNWFDTGRGTALGIVLTGTSIGGVIVPPVASPLMANYGWRTSMLALSALVWLVILPAIIFFVKEANRSYGSYMSYKANGATTMDTDGLTLAEALKSPTFWAFASVAALVFYPVVATSQQFILYVQTPKIGISAGMAAAVQSSLFASTFMGKLVAGFLSDKLGAVRVMASCSFVMFLASLVLFGLTSSTVLLFLIPFGLGYGGAFVLLQRLAADFFGRREIGKILGLITLIEVIGAAIGGLITGYMADRAGGDYTYAFYGVTIAAALAFLATLAIFALSKDRSGAGNPRFIV